MNTVNKRVDIFFPVIIFFVVCLIHVGILFCITKFSTISQKSTSQESIVNIQMVVLPEEQPVEMVMKEHPKQVSSLKLSIKNEPKLSDKHKEFVATKKAPEKQLAAKANQIVHDDANAQVAKFQNVETTQVNTPIVSGRSPTSLVQGSANQTVSKEKGNSAGAGSESTSPKLGNKVSGGGGGQSQGVRIKSSEKVYPQNQRRDNVTGTVTVDVLVGVNGRAKSVTILNSPDSRLNNPAKKTAQSARYQPAMENGVKVEKNIIYPIIYNLK